MATIDWPDALPQLFSVSGFGEQLADNTIRDEFDVGPAGVRRRSTAGVSRLSGRMVMSTEQWNRLKQFYRDDTLGGSLAFGFPEPISEEQILVRFSASPSRTPVTDDDWEVALAFEVLP